MNKNIDAEISNINDTAVVTFKTTCLSDVEGIMSVSNEIKEFISKNCPTRLIFDFSGVKFFSSQVLGLLLDIRTQMQANKGEVVITAINPQLHRVFKITNLDKIFKFFPDKESAMTATGPQDTG
jgi:anti-anti-sigma factor